MRPSCLLCFVLVTLSVLIGACEGSSSSPVTPAPDLTGPPLYAIVDVTVLPMTGPERLPRQAVLIRNGRVERLGSSDLIEVPAEATVIDGEGRYLMPGLADMHAHPMRESDLALYLANGVTLIRAMWGEPSLLALREQVDEGEIPGPRIYTSGRIVDGAVPYHFGTFPVPEPAEARAMVAEQTGAGFDFIKIYSILTLEVFDAIAAAADNLGVEFSGHVPRAVPLAHAVGSNMRTMEHLTGFLATIQRQDIPGDLEWRFADPEAQAVVAGIGRGERSLEAVLDPEARRAIVSLVAQNGVWIVPTFSVLRFHEFSALPESARYLHPVTRRIWETVLPMTAALTEDMAQGEAALFNYQLELVGDLYRAGANLLVGTDAPNPGVVTGFSVAEEIALMERAGLSRIDALRAATLWPAAYLAERGEGYGRVTEGAVADLLLLDGDPLRDLDALRSIAGVFRAVGSGPERTRWYPREELQALLGSIENAYADIEERLDRKPVPPGEASAVYSFAHPDGYRLVLKQDRQEASVRVGLAFADEAAGAPWITARVVHDDSGASLVVGDRHFRLADAGRTLLLNDHVIAKATDAAPATLLLTGTPADLASIDRAVADLAVGDRMPLSAWLCSRVVDCEEARLVTWKLERLPDSVVDGLLYYTGVRQYALFEGGARVGLISIGGGAFYGGQPIAMDVQGWPHAAMERVR